MGNKAHRMGHAMWCASIVFEQQRHDAQAVHSPGPMDSSPDDGMIAESLFDQYRWINVLGLIHWHAAC